MVDFINNNYKYIIIISILLLFFSVTVLEQVRCSGLVLKKIETSFKEISYNFKNPIQTIFNTPHKIIQINTHIYNIGVLDHIDSSNNFVSVKSKDLVGFVINDYNYETYMGQRMLANPDDYMINESSNNDLAGLPQVEENSKMNKGLGEITNFNSEINLGLTKPSDQKEKTKTANTEKQQNLNKSGSLNINSEDLTVEDYEEYLNLLQEKYNFENK
jgi:hypothetical protein